MRVSVLVKEVHFHQRQVGCRCSSSLAKCVTPPSHQHPILCDPPSHGAARPAVLPGPGQWLQCPVHRPASCLAAGMSHLIPSYDLASPSPTLLQLLSARVISRSPLAPPPEQLKCVGGELEIPSWRGNIHQKNRGTDFDSPCLLCVWRVLEAEVWGSLGGWRDLQWCGG